MELIKIIDGEPKPYSFAAFRAANKHTVYGVTISNRHLNAQDVYRVQATQEPKEIGKSAVKDAKPVLTGGAWTLGWTLEVKDAAGLRAERNALLAETDYMGLSDYPAKAGELEYRQALRDVPQQAGFPKTHTWPNKP